MQPDLLKTVDAPLSNNPSFFGIRASYLDQNRYRNTFEIASKQESLLLSYYEFIKRYYERFLVDLQAANQKAPQLKQQTRVKFQVEFSTFVSDFLTVFQEISCVKIEQVDILMSENQMASGIQGQDILSLVAKCESDQKAFFAEKDAFVKIMHELEKMQVQYQRDSNDPVLFYSDKYMLHKRKVINEVLKKRQNQIKAVSEAAEKVKDDSALFSRKIVDLRSQHLRYKHQNLLKLVHFGFNCRDSIAEFIMYLSECVNQSAIRFDTFCKDNDTSMFSSKGKKKTKTISPQEQEALINQIMTTSEEHSQLIDRLNANLTLLMHILNSVGQNTREEQAKCKEISQLIHRVYDNSQCPVVDLIDTLDLYMQVSSKLCSVKDQLYVCSCNLLKIKQNVKKHANITISLLNTQKRTEESNEPKIDAYFEQQSHQYVINCIKEGYQMLKESTNAIKNYVASKVPKLKPNKPNNSMDISFIEEAKALPTKKRPSPFEQWLWYNWREESGYFLPAFPASKSLSQHHEEPKTESKLIEKMSCSLSHKKEVRGLMRVTDSYVNFLSSDKSTSLIIPYKQVEDVQIKLSVFNKILMIETAKGELKFTNFETIEDIHTAINECRAKVPAKAQTYRQAVALLPEESASFKDREAKVKTELGQWSTWDLVVEQVYKGVRIDQIYELIYSDSPITIRGKAEDSFLSYFSKRLGLLEIKINKLNIPGPKFYCQAEGTGFHNCPLYAERHLTYKKTLPSIPLMPSQVSCEEFNRVYWVSDSEFINWKRTLSKGISISEKFEVKLAERMLKTQDGVKMECYFRFEPKCDFMGINIVKKTAISEVKQATQQKISEVNRIIKGNGSPGSNANQETNKKTDQLEEEPKAGASPQGQVNTLLKQRAILITAIVLLIILNLIF